MDFADFDKSKYPIIVYRVKPIEPTLAQYEEYLEHQKKLMLAVPKNEKMIIVFDYTHLKFLTSDMRIKRGNFIKENDELMKSTIQHIVVMSPGTVSRMMIQGVFLVRKPSVSTEVVGSMSEAISIAEELVRKVKK